MRFTYDRLWHQLKEKGISKTDLAKKAGFTSATLAKLGKDSPVNLEVLAKICATLECNIEDIIEYKNDSTSLKVVSLFSGIGGFESALDSSEIHSNVVMASEIDKHATVSFLSNFPHCNLKGDITKIDAKDIPAHELLVGGFPCQAFSIAGKREGFKDTRGTLFFDIERILALHQPRYILLENVKNFISHDSGATITTILKSLSNLGYTVDFTVINSKEAGLPQSRERTYFVGIKDGPSEKYQIDPRSKRVNSLKNELNSENYTGFNFFNKLTFTFPNKTISDILVDHPDEKFFLNNDKIERFISMKPIEHDDIRTYGIKKLFDLPRDVHNDNERQRRVYSIHGISPTILARSDSTKIYVHDNDGRARIRKITPIEALRAQGFSEIFIDNIVKSGMSDTQIYKQAGNAVSPLIVTGILNQLSGLIREGV